MLLHLITYRYNLPESITFRFFEVDIEEDFPISCSGNSVLLNSPQSLDTNTGKMEF